MLSRLRPRFGLIAEAHCKKTYEVDNQSEKGHSKITRTLPVAL